MSKQKRLMRVHIDEIKDAGLDLAFELPAETFPGLEETRRFGDCLFDHPIDFTIRLRPAGQLFIAEGRFRTDVGLTCSRCANDYRWPLTATFFMTYTAQPQETPGRRHESDVELKGSEIGLYYIQGDGEIDLLEGIQEEIVLAIPPRPLCRPDCRGLCAVCGSDLNDGDCGCSRRQVNPAFALLKNVQVKK